MRLLRVVPVLVILFFSLSVASVFAQQYAIAVPLLRTIGPPVLGAPSLCGVSNITAAYHPGPPTYSSLPNNTAGCGVLSVWYADGRPVLLSTNLVTLSLCAASCVSVSATLKQTAPGTYTYTFIPPASLTGTVTLYLLAGSLADDNGIIFPSVTTQIGTYTYSPPTTSGTSAPIGTSRPPAGTPVNQLNHVTRQAVDAIQTPTQTFPIQQLLAVLSALSLAGCLLILPSRH